MADTSFRAGFSLLRNPVCRSVIATFEDVEQAYLEHAESPVELWFEAKTDPFDPGHFGEKALD